MAPEDNPFDDELYEFEGEDDGGIESAAASIHQHTRGPWKADVSGPFLLGGDAIVVEAVTEDGLMVRREICTCLIDTEVNDDTPEAIEDKANALLIAISPKLLALAAKVVNARDKIHSSDRLYVACGGVFAAIDELAALINS